MLTDKKFAAHCNNHHLIVADAVIIACMLEISNGQLNLLTWDLMHNRYMMQDWCKLSPDTLDYGATTGDLHCL